MNDREYERSQGRLLKAKEKAELAKAVAGQAWDEYEDQCRLEYERGLTYEEVADVIERSRPRVDQMIRLSRRRHGIKPRKQLTRK